MWRKLSVFYRDQLKGIIASTSEAVRRESSNDLFDQHKVRATALAPHSRLINDAHKKLSILVENLTSAGFTHASFGPVRELRYPESRVA